MSPLLPERGTSRFALVLVATTLLVGAAACVAPPVGPRPPVIDRFGTDATGFTSPALVPVSWSVRDPNGDALTCRIDVTSDGSWDETISPCPRTGGRNLSVGEGDGIATLEVSDATHPPVTATAPYDVGPGPSEPYDIVTQLVGAPDERVTAAIADAAARWGRVIARGVPDAVVHQDPGSCTDEMPGFDGAVDDIVVLVVVVPNLPGFSADAVPCTNGPDGLPRLSLIRISATGLDWLATHDNQLGDLVTHEMGHALGFTGPLWWEFRQELGTNDFVFSGPRAVAEWSHLGGSGTVPLNDHGDHWDETILQNEVMTCNIEYVPTHPLSAVTVAAMADIGYHVDIGASEPWTVPPEPGFMTC